MIALGNPSGLNTERDVFDDIRDKLKGMGVILEDSPEGVKWKLRK